MNQMTILRKQIEDAWMAYNAAVISRLHPQDEKTRLANIMINNINDIMKALDVYAAEVDEPVGTVSVVTDEAGASVKKVRKKAG